MQTRFRASVWAVSLLLCVVLTATAGKTAVKVLAASQSTAVQKPAVEAASIRPCPPRADSNATSGRAGSNASLSQEVITCETIAQIIGRAYGWFGDPLPANARSFLDPDLVKQWVKGGPTWIYAERYTIVANASGAPLPTTMQGSVLRALLEGRLGLTVHQGRRHSPASALTVAKGGVKLRLADVGSCQAPEPNAPDRTSAPAPREKPLCGLKFGVDGPNVTLKATGATLGQIARALNLVVHRPVIDQTGIQGQFTFKIEFDQGDGLIRRSFLLNNNEESPGLGYYDSLDFYMVPGFSLSVVLARQLGLRLAFLPGPQVLTVDHVVRPSGG